MPADYDPLTEVRTERVRALVAELVPKIRRLSPEMTDDQVLAAAERMARYRLADEALGKNAL
jgi:hypothetical protein